MSDKNEFINALKSKIDDVDKELDKIDVTADQVSENVRHEIEKRKLDLREKRSDLKNKIDAASDSAESAWGELKGNLQKTADSLTRGLREIKDKLSA